MLDDGIIGEGKTSDFDIVCEFDDPSAGRGLRRPSSACSLRRPTDSAGLWPPVCGRVMAGRATTETPTPTDGDAGRHPPP